MKLLQHALPLVLVSPMALWLCACPGKGSGAGGEGDADGAPRASGPAASTVGALAPSGRGGGPCPANQVTVLVPPGRQACVIECRSNAGCPPGAACHGEGYLLTEGKVTAPVRYCVGAPRREAQDTGGAPRSAPVDGGKAAEHEG